MSGVRCQVSGWVLKGMLLCLSLLVVGCVQGGAQTAERATVEAVLTKSAPYNAGGEATAVDEPTVSSEPPTAAPEPSSTTIEASTSTEPAADLPAVIFPDEPLRELTILYTNDEHGWMEGVEENLGAANLMSTWADELGYTAEGPFLLISGGDMWTGPAISTWFEGESMAEVMNGMGYAAAAVGNHEFDFGLEALQARAIESDFPFVSANVRWKANGETPTELGIEPFTVVEVNGVRIGIIGLTTTRTRTTTNPANISELDFLNYETAVREVLPDVLAAGAELIVIPGHICEFEMRDLAARIPDLPVHLIGGGHCNELIATEADGTVLLEGGSHLATYAYAEFLFDTDTDQVVNVTYGTGFTDSDSQPNDEVAAVVAKWQAETDEELSVVIGYTERGFRQRSQEQRDLITESWLWAYPTADVAMTNLGGFRADIPAGELTFGDIVGVFPFNNVLVEVQLTGEQLLTILTSSQEEVALGGMSQVGSRWQLDRTGEEITADGTYTVLVNDFMYAGGSGFGRLAQYDPDGYNTAIDWRQPVIDWIQAQASSAQNPLDTAVQALDR